VKCKTFYEILLYKREDRGYNNLIRDDEDAVRRKIFRKSEQGRVKALRGRETHGNHLGAPKANAMLTLGGFSRYREAA